MEHFDVYWDGDLLTFIQMSSNLCRKCTFGVSRLPLPKFLSVFLLKITVLHHIESNRLDLVTWSSQPIVSYCVDSAGSVRRSKKYPRRYQFDEKSINRFIPSGKNVKITRKINNEIKLYFHFENSAVKMKISTGEIAKKVAVTNFGKFCPGYFRWNRRLRVV